MANEPGTAWRPSRECRTAVDLIRLPVEICVVALQVDQGLNRRAFEKELAVLDASGASSGVKPWVTWFVPPKEFNRFQDELIRQKAAKRARRGERQKLALRERVATFL